MHRVDASRRGPVFNRFQRRFRIGISTFGRARFLTNRKGNGYYALAEDIGPLDAASDRTFGVTTLVNDSKETVVRYIATRNTKIGYSFFERGEGIEFTLPNREGVHESAEQAKNMGNYCAGVVFFRRPAFNESMTALPEDALAAAGATVTTNGPSVRAVDGGCAAVYCADLYLVNARPLSPDPARYRIRTSSEIEYVAKRAHRMRRLSELDRDMRTGPDRLAAKYNLAEYLSENSDRLFFNNQLRYGLQRYALFASQDSRLTRAERDRLIAAERKLKDEEEER